MFFHLIIKPLLAITYKQKENNYLISDYVALDEEQICVRHIGQTRRDRELLVACMAQRMLAQSRQTHACPQGSRTVSRGLSRQITHTGWGLLPLSSSLSSSVPMTRRSLAI